MTISPTLFITPLIDFVMARLSRLERAAIAKRQRALRN